MSSGWQEAAAQQAEEVSARLRQLLISGLGLLRSELGLELGLEPQQYPAWVFLVVPASLGLCLLFLLLHCASGRGPPCSKRGPQHEKEPSTQPQAPVPNKVVEEPKKKSKRKAAEKAKPNGRPVELSEEIVIPAVKKESPKQPLEEKKNEKIKKTKKKPKADAKQTHPSNQDKKEAEEGNWETKVSNKEKRQQRKRDKGADTDVPDDNLTITTVIPTQSANIRKSKGPSEVSTLNGSSWNEKQTKVIPSQLVEEKWAPVTNTAGKKKAEPCTWNQDAVDSNGKEWSAPWGERSIFPGLTKWSSVDTRLNSSEKRPPFSTIALNNVVSASASDPVTQTGDNQWEVTPPEPSVDDEWSGQNGLNSSDPSCDWNAPAEEWGNYGEEEPVPGAQTEEQEQEVQKVSDDDKEKEDPAAQTSANKTKKKKKKKKKQGEESGSPTQQAESMRDTVNDNKKGSAPASLTPVIPTVVAKSNELKEKQTVQEKRLHTVFTEAPVSAMHNISEKSPATALQPQEANAAVTKQNSVPPPSQAKSEESWESPKQVKKKKKARRET